MTRLIITNNGNIELHTDTKNTTTIKKLEGDVYDIFFGDNRISIDKVEMDQKTHKEMNKIDEDLNKVFSTTLNNVKSADRMDHQRKRTIDTFMLNGLQFIRIGEKYVTIDTHDTMIEVGRTKYYNNKKKAHHAV